MLFAKATIDCAAVAEACTASPSTPFMLSLYALKFLPKLGSFAPQTSKVLSPSNQETIPPSFGMLFAKATIDCAAVAEACTASPSTPFMLSLYALKFLPKLGSFAPQTSMSFSPAKNPATPPLFGILFANSANDFAAIAEACTASPSTPFILLEYSAKYGAKIYKSFPNFVRELPPVNQAVNPFKISIAVRIKTISANRLIAFTASTFTVSSPAKNGRAFIMKSERFCPMSGKALEISTRKLFMILPAKDPKISPN